MREQVRTLILVVLACFGIFFATKVWLVLPERTSLLKPIGTNTDISDQVIEMIVPEKAILNFGVDEHTVIYDVRSIWPNYYDLLRDKFSEDKIELLRMEKIDKRAYYLLQGERSLIFSINNEVYEEVLTEILNLKDEPSFTGKIRELYFTAKGNFVVLVTDNAYYQVFLDDSPIPTIATYLEGIYQDQKYTPYQNLWELYRVESLAYIPTGAIPSPKQRAYEDQLSKLDNIIRADLAERFLEQSVERAKLIRESESTLYVSGQKSFRIDDSGYLDYRDKTVSNKSSEDMTATLSHALDFLLQKTGLSKELFIQSMTPIELQGNKGYSIDFSFIENPYYVIPNNYKGKGYISMQIFDDHVTYLHYIYRSIASEETETEVSEDLMGIDQIIEDNFENLQRILGDPEMGLEDFWGNVSNVSLLYIDDVLKSKSTLNPCYRVNWNQKVFYFDATTGIFLMEKR